MAAEVLAVANAVSVRIFSWRWRPLSPHVCDMWRWQPLHSLRILCLRLAMQIWSLKHALLEAAQASATPTMVAARWATNAGALLGRHQWPHTR